MEQEGSPDSLLGGRQSCAGPLGGNLCAARGWLQSSVANRIVMEGGAKVWREMPLVVDQEAKEGGMDEAEGSDAAELYGKRVPVNGPVLRPPVGLEIKLGVVLMVGPDVGQEDQGDQGGGPWGQVDQGDLESGPGGELCESAAGVGQMRIVV